MLQAIPNAHVSAGKLKPSVPSTSVAALPRAGDPDRLVKLEGDEGDECSSVGILPRGNRRHGQRGMVGKSAEGCGGVLRSKSRP